MLGTYLREFLHHGNLASVSAIFPTVSVSAPLRLFGQPAITVSKNGSQALASLTGAT
jgi:hypothetical protein